MQQNARIVISFEDLGHKTLESQERVHRNLSRPYGIFNGEDHIIGKLTILTNKCDLDLAPANDLTLRDYLLEAADSMVNSLDD